MFLCKVGDVPPTPVASPRSPGTPPAGASLLRHPHSDLHQSGVSRCGKMSCEAIPERAMSLKINIKVNIA
jgi:hypothetical protein